MAGLGILLLGVIIGFVGLVIRVVPGLDRPKRRWVYRNYRFTRDLFNLRIELEGSKSDVRIEDEWVVRAFLDWLDANHPREVPDREVVAVRPFAADMEVTFINGEAKNYPLGKIAHRVTEDLVTDAMASKCRWHGLLIAIAGAVMTIVGSALIQMDI